MLKVYLNYPNKRVTVHHDPHCSDIQKNRKRHQRYILINITNIHHELQEFKNVATQTGVKNKQYLFRAEPAFNDMWLEIDFQDEEFEMAVAGYIHRLLGQRYKRFSDSQLKPHECDA